MKYKVSFHTILTVKFQEIQPGLLASVLPSPPPAPPASPPASQPGNCQAYLMTDLELWSWQKVNLAWWQQHSQLSCLQSVWKISAIYRYYHYSHESRGGTWWKSSMHTKQIQRTFHLTLGLLHTRTPFLHETFI